MPYRDQRRDVSINENIKVTNGQGENVKPVVSNHVKPLKDLSILEPKCNKKGLPMFSDCELASYSKTGFS
jgi:hypothetical protein